MPGLPRKASSEPLRHVTLKKAQRPQDEPLRAVAKSKEKKLKERGAVTRLRNCSPYLGAYGPEDHSATGTQAGPNLTRVELFLL